MNANARERRVCQIAALPALLVCIIQQYVLIQNGSVTENALESSSLFYSLAIRISAIGYGSLGAFVSGAFSALSVTFFYFRLHLGFPWLWHLTFFSISGIIFYFIIQMYKVNVRDRIELNDLEASYNDLSLVHQKSVQTVKSIKNKIRRYSQVRELGEKLASTLSLNEVANRTLKLLHELVGKGDTISLFLLDQNLKSLVLTHEIHLTERSRSTPADAHDVFNLWMMKNRQNLYVENVNADFRFEKNTNHAHAASLICVPLITGNKLIGTIRMMSQDPQCFAIDELRVLSTLASIVSTSLKNAHLYGETLELSLRDGLTGLFVSTHFRQELQKAFDISQKNQQPLTVLMADIDDFKKVNDQFGHTVGDSVLKKISETIREVIDDAYIPTRYGGEEFSAFFPGWDLGKTHSLAEELRQRIAGISFDIRRKELHVSISLGISSRNAEDLSQDQLLQRADTYLYTAKKEGKNRVCTES